jgi:hypothetical protein
MPTSKPHAVVETGKIGSTSGSIPIWRDHLVQRRRSSSERAFDDSFNATGFSFAGAYGCRHVATEARTLTGT